MPTPPPPLPNAKNAIQRQPPLVPANDDGGEQRWLIAGVAGSSLLTLLLLLLVLLLARDRSSGPGKDGAKGAGSVEIVLGSEASGDALTGDPPNGATEPMPTEAAEESLSEAPEERTSAEHLAESQEETILKARVIPIFEAPATTPQSRGAVLSANGKNPFLSSDDEPSIVFVIDKSSSMGNGNLQRVAEALIDAIDRLNASQSFQVIFFDNAAHFHPSLSGLNKASAKNKRLVVDWIRQVSPGGGTEPLDAMLVALEGKPARTILLSDGEFNINYVDDITERNRKLGKSKVRIDCIGLNEVVVSLQELAKQNGPGIYFQAR